MFDLYIWKSPRDVDAHRAEVLLKNWHEAGGDQGNSPKELPRIDASSDIAPNLSATPILLSTTSEPPARVVGLRLSPGAPRAELDAIFGLAAKYDLVLFDTRSGRVHLPLDATAAHASATFWRLVRYRLQSLAASAA